MYRTGLFTSVLYLIRGGREILKIGNEALLHLLGMQDMGTVSRENAFVFAPEGHMKIDQRSIAGNVVGVEDGSSRRDD
jgi:hypothetical protein